MSVPTKSFTEQWIENERSHHAEVAKAQQEIRRNRFWRGLGTLLMVLFLGYI